MVPLLHWCISIVSDWLLNKSNTITWHDVLFKSNKYKITVYCIGTCLQTVRTGKTKVYFFKGRPGTIWKCLLESVWLESCWSCFSWRLRPDLTAGISPTLAVLKMHVWHMVTGWMAWVVLALVTALRSWRYPFWSCPLASCSVPDVLLGLRQRCIYGPVTGGGVLLSSCRVWLNSAVWK